MFLKSIEIRGFKSFADRIELSFRGGITAVVGPNGSGKSNISDAVRWVLGEQSVKSLRGGKMEDVIFAGTQFRKAVGLAQVALTLDNSDNQLSIAYSDITVSRRLYRSGESEYYINNTHCRLKDLQELFMDTGIGKEGYSIIGQGKIDAILSSRPEERRALLEEAAGIVKFKSRKEEAQRKLDNTDQNLLRINDILSTYEERLEPLRIDNEKAKEFILLSEILKKDEISLILYSVQILNEKLEKQISEMNILGKEIEDIVLQRAESREKIEELSVTLETHETQVSMEKENYYDLKNKYQANKSEISILNERVMNLSSYIEKCLKDVENLSGKFTDLQLSNKLLEIDLIKQQQEQNMINKDIASREEVIDEINKVILNSQISRDKCREETIELMRKVSDGRNSIGILKNSIDSQEKKLKQLYLNCDNYVTLIKINSDTKLELESDVLDLSTAIKKDEDEIKNKKMEISKYNTLLSTNELNLKKQNNSLNIFEANHNMLINLENQYEGYAKAVKNLMSHIQDGKIPAAKNSSFLLGNVINAESKFETAIEIALGGAISDIITRDEETAKILIEYLKKSNLGRATFLPLNILKHKPLVLDTAIRSINGFIGIASDLIEYDDMFSPAIKYVLGRTIVSSNMDSALNISRKCNFSYKVVTLTGEVINPGGSLTGGSIYHKSVSIISRRREIEEIAIKISETKSSIDISIKDLENTKISIEEIDAICLKLRDVIYNNHIELTKFEGKIIALIDEIDKLNENLKISRNEILLTKNEVSDFLKQLSEKEKLIEVLLEEEKVNEQTAEACETIIRKEQSNISEIRDQYMEFKIKVAQIDESVSNRRKEIERIDSEIQASQKLISTQNREIQISSDNLKKNKLSIDEYNKNMKILNKSITEIELKFEGNSILRIELKSKLKQLSEVCEGLNIIVEKKEEEKHKTEIAITRQESEKEVLFSRLNEEFIMTYAEALKFRIEIKDPDQLKKAITTTKINISALGVINLGAIEEYDQIKEKYTFMNDQKEDLIKAKNELENVINEMTHKMKLIFSENFAKLKENFSETFRELFKGGSADLILSEGDELTASIDINVQPPGKKLQNINLMSGGEKVLSAIALLFAILKMKPTPFCILDEIEAALDDANVARYAEFLKKFSQNIQFIVITHRKGTMEVSDVLYGVTMEEKGISKVVSVHINRQ